MSMATLDIKWPLLIKVAPVNKVAPSRAHVWSKAKRQPSVSLLLPKYPIVSTGGRGGDLY